MIYLKLFSFLVFSLTSGFCSELTLKNFIELAEKNDPKFKQIFSESERLKFIKDDGLPTRQVILSVSNEKGYGMGDNSDTSTISAEISKEIIESGTAISVSHTESIQPGREEEVSQIRLEQSLLKNAFGRDVRLKKESLNLQVSLGELRVLENYEEYLLNLSSLYLDYKKAFLGVKLAQNVYLEAKKIKDNVGLKYKSKIANKTDLDRSKLLVLLREEDLVTKKKDLDLIKESLQQVIGKEVKVMAPSNLTEQYFAREVFASESPMDYKASRKFKIAKSEVEVFHKEAILTGRENGATLNLIAGYNQDNSQRFNTTADRTETVVGLKLDIPFGDSKGKAAKEIALVRKRQYELTLKEVNSQMLKEFKNINIELKELRKKVSINKMKTKLTGSILKDEEQRYRYGKIDLDKLIETSNNYAAYRFEFQSNKVELNKAVLKWFALSDQLIERKGSL